MNGAARSGSYSTAYGARGGRRRLKLAGRAAPRGRPVFRLRSDSPTIPRKRVVAPTHSSRTLPAGAGQPTLLERMMQSLGATGSTIAWGALLANALVTISLLVGLVMRPARRVALGRAAAWRMRGPAISGPRSPRTSRPSSGLLAVAAIWLSGLGLPGDVPRAPLRRPRHRAEGRGRGPRGVALHRRAQTIRGR